MTTHTHQARVYLAQARHVRIKQPQHQDWYWTLIGWAAKCRRAAMTPEPSGISGELPAQLELF
ncbi:hypothetical protein [Chitinilyticum litopenaei]|uniref:hypothetical protein n=1 Tax=Chitinilyticum litopenaei TaxID=1121276 RepID=UPI0003FC3181|nr:hypothetical protein [Chitinilyticum litopenaei]